MSFALGVFAFALALLVSIAWHELGHMWAAQATGMKVRRYFVGFGPTLWSTRRGETEYGVKALPLGGFCDIAGMTPYDELSEEDAPRAMYRQATWKRLVVLLAGPMQNFILGFVLIVVLALGWGLPNLGAPPTPARVAETFCVSDITVTAEGQDPSECTGSGPAAAAGLQPGDTIVEANGRSVAVAADLTAVIRETGAGEPVALVVDRGGQRVPVEVVPQQITITDATGEHAPETRNMIGISYDAPPAVLHYNFLTVWGGAVSFAGDLAVETAKSLASLPSKISGLWTAVTGGERAQDSPVSVYGASVMGGEAAERGMWSLFIALLLSVNFFLGAFNLIPLLPLDGGHMAIAIFEKARNTVRGWFGKAAAGPVDYYKLMPLTYAVIGVMGAFMLLTLTADIINPIQIF